MNVTGKLVYVEMFVASNIHWHKVLELHTLVPLLCVPNFADRDTRAWLFRVEMHEESR